MSIFSGTSEQRSVGLFAQTRLDLRIHRNDAVSLALHVGRHAVAGAQGIVRESDHRDGFRVAQQFSDGICLREEAMSIVILMRKRCRRATLWLASLFLVRGVHLLLVHLQRQLADGLRNFLVGGNVFQVLRQQMLHQP